MTRKWSGGLIGLALVVTVLLAGCGAYPASQEMAPVEAHRGLEQDAAGYAGTAGDGDVANQSTQADRMIIWNAEMSLTVEDAETALAKAEAVAHDAGGYVISSEAWLSGEQLQARLTLRVPADKYEAVMAGLRALAVKVNRENATSQDVTEEYVDLESRLRHLEAKEKELLQFLDKAEDTEAVLAVYEQVSSTQAEIEQVKGRMTYLAKLTAMATITVELSPVEAELPVVEEGWKPARTFRNAARALINALEAIGSGVIWFVVGVLPVLLVLAVPVVLVVWLVRRRRRGHRKEESAS